MEIVLRGRPYLNSSDSTRFHSFSSRVLWATGMSAASSDSFSSARRVARRHIPCRGSSAGNGLWSQGSVATSKNFRGWFTPETGLLSVMRNPRPLDWKGLALGVGAFHRVHEPPG